MADNAPMQRGLWDWQSLPDREDLVAMVAARSFLGEKKLIDQPKDNGGVTGERALKRLRGDVELCEEICTALVLGVSVKLVAKRFHMSPRSVRRIKQAMEDRGELAPVRLRIQRQLDQFVEEGLEAMNEGVLSGAIHPGQLPIPVLAAIDKRAQLEVNVVPGTGRTVKQITADDLKAELDLMSTIDLPPSETDSGSAGSVHKALEISEPCGLDTALDTNPTTEQAAQNPVLEGVDADLDAEKVGRGSASSAPGGVNALG